jgi:signal transduction histidine kinase
MHREFQHAILSSKIEIQEQTFQEISQEIHDNIGQILSLAKLHIATMESGGSPALDNKIREAKNLVSKAIHDLRNLSHRLNTGYITEVGFDTAVKRELETIRRSGVYDTRFILIGRACRFDQQKELILFRIVQELLNNIIKHAKAKTITVELNYSPEGLLAQIRDDGKGFDRASITTRSNGRSPNDHNPEQADPLAAASRSEDHGLGIPSMYHRASLIEAEFQLTSTIGAGTLATIRLPLAVPKALAKKSPL